MIEIPIRYSDGIEKLCTQLDHDHPHIGGFWIFMFGLTIFLSICFIIMLVVDQGEKNVKVRIIKYWIGFLAGASCAFAIIFAVNDRGTSSLTITRNYPAFKNSNLTIYYDGGQHGKITVDDWKYKIADIDWTDIDTLKIKPTNNIGRATNTMAKFLKKHKKKWYIHVTGYRVTASHDNIYGRKIYTVYTEEGHKV